MKRVFVCLILVMVLFTGCSTLDIDKQSQNLTNYYIDVDLNFNEKTATLNEKIDYYNKCDIVLDELRFHLYPNAFTSRDLSVLPVTEFNYAKAYPNGFDAGSIKIESVSIENKQIDFELLNEDSILKINLLEGLYPTKRVEISLSAKIKIPNLKHRFGYAEDTLNFCNFYPIACVYENGEFIQDRYTSNGDPFYSEVSNYLVNVTYDSNLKVGSTGWLEKSVTADKTTSTYKAKVVRDFGMTFSEKFEKLEKTVDGIKYTYLYYDDDLAEKHLQTMIDAVNTFGNLLGKYPYPTITAVKSDFIYGGMEYPNFVIISDDLVNERDYLNALIHEIGHQWFYGIVGNNEVKEAWLDEGLTECITALFYELNPSYGVEYQEVVASALSSYLLFVDVYEDVFGERFNTSMNRSLSEFNSEPEYTYLIYVKGLLLLDNLRSVVGDSGFFLGLKSYYENSKFGVATTDCFIAMFEKATNKNLENIIKSWLNGNVVIEG